MPQQAIDALSKVTAGANVAAAQKTVAQARRTQPKRTVSGVFLFLKCGADFFGSLPRFIRKGFDFRDTRGGGSADGFALNRGGSAVGPIQEEREPLCRKSGRWRW